MAAWCRLRARFLSAAVVGEKDMLFQLSMTMKLLAVELGAVDVLGSGGAVDILDGSDGGGDGVLFDTSTLSDAISSDEIEGEEKEEGNENFILDSLYLSVSLSLSDQTIRKNPQQEENISIEKKIYIETEQRRHHKRCQKKKRNDEIKRSMNDNSKEKGIRKPPHIQPFLSFPFLSSIT